MENINWKDHKANEYFLDIVKENIMLLNTVSERKNQWLGHILRVESLVKEVIEGRMEEKRGIGKTHIILLDDIKTQ